MLPFIVINCLADIYGFFFHAISDEEGILSLEDLHSLLRDVWLTRHDAELEEERSARRRGRPKSAKELKLEDTKLREMEEYRTGMGSLYYHYPTFLSLTTDIERHPRPDASKKCSTIQEMGPERIGLHQATSLHQNIS